MAHPRQGLAWGIQLSLWMKTRLSLILQLAFKTFILTDKWTKVEVFDCISMNEKKEKNISYLKRSLTIKLAIKSGKIQH